MYNQQLPMPWRRYQMQPVWRAENPQKGRFREFLQSDADIYGSTSPIADAEIVALANAIFQKIGFKEYSIFINDRNLLFKMLEYIAIPTDLQLSVIQSIDKLDKKSESEVADELKSKGLEKMTIDHLFEHLRTIEPSENLQKVMQNVISLGVEKEKLVFQPGLARGLDYYTGTIFEIKIKDYEAGSVLGGGRYDKLINLLSAVDIPAVGFALGFDRAIEAMEQFNLFPSQTLSNRVLVSIFNTDLQQYSEVTTAFLRQYNIPVEIYPNESAKLDKQLKYADKKGIKWFIVIGPSEAEKDIVILKDLQTGHQEDVKLGELVSRIDKKVSISK
jgi:histidyl-tRNA synthetase